MKAILSCIHGNLEALQAVIADAASKGATEIVCLGDLIGYGPNPVECVNLSMLWPIVLQGNFDAAALYEVDFAGWTAVIAANSVRWFQGLMKESEEGARCAVFLSKRPHIHHEGKFVFVHGTPCARRNLFEYVLPEDIWNSKKMARIGESFDGHCFNGHTHVAGLFIEAAGEWTYLNPKDCDYHYQFSSQKTICNVGSVGQPVDEDWRASYVLFDGKGIEFRRVEYDIDTTVRKILANPHLDNWLAQRLREGR